MLFKSGLVTQVSGSFGGMTGSHNRGGLYLRARAIPVNPNTIPQQLLRGIFGSLVLRWNNLLTTVQRDAWNVYASLVPLLGPLGDPVITSGQNQYIRSNTGRVQGGLAIIDAAPTQFDTGTLSSVSNNSTLAPSEATQIFSIVFTDTDAWNVAGGALLSYASRPQNPSINFFKGPYRFVTASLGSVPQVSPIALTWPFPFVAGQSLFLRVRATLADGRLTQQQFIGPVTAVA